MSTSGFDEKEWQTRKRRIDPKLDAWGWTLPPSATKPIHQPFRTEEEETDTGPADYALWLGNQVVGIVEAKKVSVGPQGRLTQAERYARGLRSSPHNFGGLRCPFLYATNGEIIWYHDVRHPLNLSREISTFHTPSALQELLSRDFEAECAALAAMPNDHSRLRDYQRQANDAIEQAIADRKRHLLVAMATGTGKTFTMVNQAYRLMKSGVAKRILFLVDRRALAAQAVRTFASFEAEPGKKFDQIYEVYSSRFQTGDFTEEDKFDPKVLPNSYLTDPQPGHAFVYVCTIQRMAINLMGRDVIFGVGDEEFETDVDRLDIPIHAFDFVIADECHRGYTSTELSVWRNTLNHFDAIKVGLTATPAAHTSAYFQHNVFHYPYEQAVRDGYLVDYDVVNVRSEVRMNGVFLEEGENVQIVDPTTGLSRMDQLEDERAFDTTEVESKVTAPESNRKILEELKKYCDEHEERYGRFPKTLIFAVNDLPHTSHADQLVRFAREIFGRGDAFVEKITGRVDRPLQAIREFRNRPRPGIVVTVDLLSTGVDIPDLEFIVFLRPVKSRILFEQMMGRGTRKGENYPDKSHFTVFDCFDGTLLEYFRNSTGISEQPPDQPARTIEEVIDDIWNNRDRDYNIRCLVKRLQRIDKQMSAAARQMFAAFIPDGDVAKYARELPGRLREDFTETMQVLRNRDFQGLLVDYPRASRTFIVAPEQEDTVESEWIARDIAGQLYKPADYLQVFQEYVRENPAHVQAIQILLDRPRDWSGTALTELREKLAQSRYRFTEEALRKAHRLHYGKALVDIISMVKHAADETVSLLTTEERVEQAFAAVLAETAPAKEQRLWLDRIKIVMIKNLSIDHEDFELQRVLSGPGGWGAATHAFGEDKLRTLIHRLNEAIAA